MNSLLAAEGLKLSLDTQTLALIVGTVVPLLVGVVTKSSAGSTVKVLVNAILATLAALLTLQIQNGSLGNANLIVNTAIFTFISSCVSYNHIWKKTGVAEQVQAATANVGIG